MLNENGMLNKDRALNKNIETFIGCDKSFHEAKFVLVGVPFDSTTSYRPGARFAMKNMRAESYAIETYSPYQDKDLEDTAVFDAGDLELSIGNTEMVMGQIEEFIETIMKAKKVPAIIGGEHLISFPAIKAIHKYYPDMHVLHFDAHADLRDDYLGAKLSHATVMRRVWELLGDNRVHQFGIRSGEKSEFLWGKNHVNTQKFNFDGLGHIVESLKGKPIYLTIDLDVLDPSIFPGTGTPEAGGVSFSELLGAINLLHGSNIIGFDMVELSPIHDPSGVSTAVACKLLREILLALEV
ncbi:MAG: agmatinase [Defluviitaleaceae bacterium]|nr:agmatinase [Defluviitaleaceae bacterium]